jgi:uncharacterized protein (DUF433 family)
MAVRRRREFGAYIVSDPEICGGDLTFKGTRILVKDVLYYAAQGKDWSWIVSAYRNSISPEAIGEAIDLASEALTTKIEKRRSAA